MRHGLGSGAAPQVAVLLVRAGRFFRLVEVDTTNPGVVLADAETESDSSRTSPAGIDESIIADSQTPSFVDANEAGDVSTRLLWSPSGWTSFLGGAGGLSPFFAGSSLGLGYDTGFPFCC